MKLECRGYPRKQRDQPSERDFIPSPNSTLLYIIRIKAIGNSNEGIKNSNGNTKKVHQLFRYYGISDICFHSFSLDPSFCVTSLTT